MIKRSPMLSVIIPTYKDWDKLVHCIRFLDKQTLGKEFFEVVVVNNDPETKVPDYFSEFHFVRFVAEAKPGSYAARNTGITYAQTELFVFTDSDCIPDEGWLECIYSKYKKSDGRTLIAGDVHVQKLEDGPANIIEKYDAILGLPQKRYVSRGYAVTANLAIPRAVLDQIGTFDSQRFSGGDAEICLRARGLGFGLCMEDRAFVKHPARSSWSELTTKVKRVKGGQIRNGPIKRRLMYLVRTFIPPVRAYYKIIRSSKVSIFDVGCLLIVQTVLWSVEMLEVAKLLLGAMPERR